MIEAMLGVPQVYRNCHRKSTHGLSLTLVLCWFVGDTFKTYYYFFREVPLQLSVCALFQLSVDVLILLQVLYYCKIKPCLEGRREARAAEQKKSTPQKAKYKRAEEEVSTDDDDAPSNKVQPNNPTQKLSNKKKAKAFRSLVNEE